MPRVVLLCLLIAVSGPAYAQTANDSAEVQSDGGASVAAPKPAPTLPSEFDDPDAKLNELAALIAEKKMNELYVELIRYANLTHPVKNIDPEALRRIGHSLLGLFVENEVVHYVDKVKDEPYGTTLRRVVYLAYTSRDRWVYFNFVLKRGAVGWQMTKFDFFVDRFDLFPEPAGQ